MPDNAQPPKRWMEGAIVYQIYPRSFKDSNRDGIGDLQGVISKLGYLKDLGVHAIWLSPFYTSPMADFGYDVADYCDVDPVFGNLADAKELLTRAHHHDIRVMVDLVPNHSSDEHEWFKDSKKSKTNPHADWYIWRDPKGFTSEGKPIPPNNWIEVFSGESAWEWNNSRKQFYLHSFNVHQPDLNWSHPEVRDAIKDVMRFWLDLGVDGFRVDAVDFMAKDPLFTDDPLNRHYKAGKEPRYGRLQHEYSKGTAQLSAYLSEMGSVLRERAYAERQPFMVLESYPSDPDHVRAYLNFYESVDPQVAAPFNFEGLSLDWDAQVWHEFLQEFHEALDEFSDQCVPSYAFGNHDQSRIASRLEVQQARAAAVLLMTLPGMVFIYNGDELGMHDVPIPPKLIHDPGAFGGIGRDPERTPLQWTPGEHAGFTEGSKTWLPLADDYKQFNVETESEDPNSFLSMYRRLGQLRNNSPALRYGSLRVIDTSSPDILAFVRRSQDEAYITLVNFSDETAHCKFEFTLGSLVASSTADTNLADQAGGKISLLPHEAAIFSLSAISLVR